MQMVWGVMAAILAGADNLAAQLRAIISNLYMLIVQAHDYQGPGTQQAMQGEMYGHVGYGALGRHV